MCMHPLFIYLFIFGARFFFFPSVSIFFFKSDFVVPLPFLTLKKKKKH